MKCVTLTILSLVSAFSLAEIYHEKRNFTEKSKDFSSETLNPDGNIRLIAFSAAKTEALKGHEQLQKSLGFDHVFYNEGKHFEPLSGIFTAPVSGIYEFTFCGRALPHKKLSLQLIKNYVEIQTLAYDGHVRKKPHGQTQKILLDLRQDERVWIRLAASNHYGVGGGSSRATTFTGRLISLTKDATAADANGEITFLASYSDVRTLSAEPRDTKLIRSKRNTAVTRDDKDWKKGVTYAFSVARTFCLMGRNAPYHNRVPFRNGIITFDKPFVNAGKTFDLGLGEFTAPLSGLWYFSFTVGKYPRKKLSVSLIKNDNEFQLMAYDESKSNRRQMQSQSVILRLEEGDKIWLKSYDSPDYAVYSNLGNYITFNGYLL